MTERSSTDIVDPDFVMSTEVQTEFERGLAEGIRRREALANEVLQRTMEAEVENDKLREQLASRCSAATEDAVAGDAKALEIIARALWNSDHTYEANHDEIYKSVNGKKALRAAGFVLAALRSDAAGGVSAAATSQCSAASARPTICECNNPAILLNADGSEKCAKCGLPALAQPPAHPDNAELVARLRGRALFLRNRGGVKSPELMEKAALALSSTDQAGGK